MSLIAHYNIKPLLIHYIIMFNSIMHKKSIHNRSFNNISIRLVIILDKSEDQEKARLIYSKIWLGFSKI